MSLKVRTSSILLLHAILIFVAAVSAWTLRFEFYLPNLQLLLTVAPVLIVYRLAALARFGLLHGYWRYTGLHDGIDMSKALILSSAAFFLSIRYVLGIKAFPLSVYCLESLAGGVCTPRGPAGISLRLCSVSRSNPVLIAGDRAGSSSWVPDSQHSY